MYEWKKTQVEKTQNLKKLRGSGQKKGRGCGGIVKGGAEKGRGRQRSGRE